MGQGFELVPGSAAVSISFSHEENTLGTLGYVHTFFFSFFDDRIEIMRHVGGWVCFFFFFFVYGAKKAVCSVPHPAN